MQQDGAKSHIHPTDEAFLAGLAALGVANKPLLYTQPANSPHTNISRRGELPTVLPVIEKALDLL